MSSCFLFVNDEDTNKKINIDDLYEKKHKQDLKQLSIFNKILNRIHKRIETTGRVKTKEHYIWFQVPGYLFGEPLYDESHCIAYIVSKLEDNGFHVRYIHPNTLFISWEHWIPSYVRNEIRRKMGVVIDERGRVIKNGEGQRDKSSEEDDINSGLYKTSGEVNAGKHRDKDNKEKKYTSIKQYKPTGNLVYDNQLFETIEKRVTFA